MVSRLLYALVLVAFWFQLSVAMIQPSGLHSCFPHFILIIFIAVRTLAQNVVLDSIPQADTDDTPSAPQSAATSNSGSVQYMITSAMRRTLEDELGYTVLEVSLLFYFCASYLIYSIRSMKWSLRLLICFCCIVV